MKFLASTVEEIEVVDERTCCAVRVGSEELALRVPVDAGAGGGGVVELFDGLGGIAGPEFGDMAAGVMILVEGGVGGVEEEEEYQGAESGKEWRESAAAFGSEFHGWSFGGELKAD